MFVSVIANQIRTPVDWISTIGPRHPCSRSSSLVRFVRETRAVRHFDIARGIDRQLTTQQQVRPRPFPAEIMSAHPRVIDRRRVPGSTSHKSHRAFRALQLSGNFPSTLRTWPPDTPALSLPPPTQAFTRWPNTSATSARPSRVRARFIPSPRVARGPSSSSGEQRRK